MSMNRLQIMTMLMLLKYSQISFTGSTYNFFFDYSKTRKGRNSVTFAEMIATSGVDNMTGLSITAPEQGVVEYPDWLTSLENTRYQHSFIPRHHQRVPGVWVPLCGSNKTIDKTCFAISINNFIQPKYKQNI